MASLITAPSCCMILFMSLALLLLLPLQAHGAIVDFTYCNPLDDDKFLVRKIDMERTPIGQDKEIVSFIIELGDGFKDADFSGKVNISVSTFLPSGEFKDEDLTGQVTSSLSSEDQPPKLLLAHYVTLSTPTPSRQAIKQVFYAFFNASPARNEVTCAKIVVFPPF